MVNGYFMDGLLGQSTGWVETHPNQSWMVWDYLRSPAKNLSFLAGYWADWPCNEQMLYIKGEQSLQVFFGALMSEVSWKKHAEFFRQAYAIYIFLVIMYMNLGEKSHGSVGQPLLTC